VGSFTIWTHHLKGQSLASAFVPTGCQGAGQPALEVGAGTNVQELFGIADNYNKTVIGGFVPSVGAGKKTLLESETPLLNFMGQRVATYWAEAQGHWDQHTAWAWTVSQTSQITLMLVSDYGYQTCFR
jgi:hypothetical protein